MMESQIKGKFNLQFMLNNYSNHMILFEKVVFTIILDHFNSDKFGEINLTGD